MISFNKHFGVSDPNTEHLDILLEADLEAFICPFMLKSNRQHKLANAVYTKFQKYMVNVNTNYVSTGDRQGGILLLSRLREANEYHLGYSGSNTGKGVGTQKAELAYESLVSNSLARQGVSVVNEPENALLLVEGIGQDNMSDAIANVCRDLFADYTLRQCQKYRIGVFETRIEYYDATVQKWKKKKVLLPHYLGKPIILVPQNFASGARVYPERYNWHISSDHIALDLSTGKLVLKDGDDLIIELKDGRKKAVVKNIYHQFRKPKGELVDFVIQYPKSLESFMDHVKEHLPPISHEGLLKLRKKAS